ncbi:hypothetical protein COY05_00160 [Candidatus Peregrinibacteria bacterium CG_4_10_14_0_2_um_filter_38_24]|nr:MAG: hypothetical protein COY05_00160 [Candidatus Peregrinibacteria bacterium CG_4_10_14_0_2_um_filter_38_24]
MLAHHTSFRLRQELKCDCDLTISWYGRFLNDFLLIAIEIIMEGTKIVRVRLMKNLTIKLIKILIKL